MLSNLFAGVQLAMTQPVRIQDVVIVEGEWGTIEEITSTYVVVRIWDLRRLIVPLTYFIEKPFQNWTRDSTALIGVVYFYLDYRAPIGAIRDKLNEIVKTSPDWNAQTVALVVTDSKESTIEVRATMSANSAGQTWNLRCEVREKIIDFLQREHPEALPRQRNELAATGAAGQMAHVGGQRSARCRSRQPPRQAGEHDWKLRGHARECGRHLRREDRRDRSSPRDRYGARRRASGRKNMEREALALFAEARPGFKRATKVLHFDPRRLTPSTLYKVDVKKRVLMAQPLKSRRAARGRRVVR